MLKALNNLIVSLLKPPLTKFTLGGAEYVLDYMEITLRVFLDGAD